MPTDFTREKIRLDSEFPFNLYAISEFESTSESLHAHDCWELNYVEKGSGNYFIEDKVFPVKEGDIFIFHNLVHHRAVSQKGMTMLVFTFNPKIIWLNQDEFRHLLSFYERYSYFTGDKDKEQRDYRRILHHIRLIKKEWTEKEECYQLMIKSSLLGILGTLHRYQARKVKEEREGAASDTQLYQKKFERVRPVLEYLAKHFSEVVTMENIAKETLQSKSNITANFRQIMECTVFEYLDVLRVSESCMLLKTTDEPVTEIALKCGFNSSSYFNRVFKKTMGISPGEYRKEA